MRDREPNEGYFGTARGVHSELVFGARFLEGREPGRQLPGELHIDLMDVRFLVSFGGTGALVRCDLDIERGTPCFARRALCRDGKRRLELQGRAIRVLEPRGTRHGGVPGARGCRREREFFAARWVERETTRGTERGSRLA